MHKIRTMHAYAQTTTDKNLTVEWVSIPRIESTTLHERDIFYGLPARLSLGLRLRQNVSLHGNNHQRNEHPNAAATAPRPCI